MDEITSKDVILLFAGAILAMILKSLQRIIFDKFIKKYKEKSAQQRIEQDKKFISMQFEASQSMDYVNYYLNLSTLQFQEKRAMLYSVIFDCVATILFSFAYSQSGYNTDILLIISFIAFVFIFIDFHKYLKHESLHQTYKQISEIGINNIRSLKENQTLTFQQTNKE